MTLSPSSLCVRGSHSYHETEREPKAEEHTYRYSVLYHAGSPFPCIGVFLMLVLIILPYYTTTRPITHRPKSMRSRTPFLHTLAPLYMAPGNPHCQHLCWSLCVCCWIIRWCWCFRYEHPNSHSSHHSQPQLPGLLPLTTPLKLEFTDLPFFIGAPVTPARTHAYTGGYSHPLLLHSAPVVTFEGTEIQGPDISGVCERL